MPGLLAAMGVLLLYLCVPAGSRAADAPATVASLEQQMQALLDGMDQVVRTAAYAIPDPGRRLLALRAYVRAGEGLRSRWSWTADEAARFADSPDGAALARDVERVRCVFSAAHPGHELFVNPAFRSLEIQLARWNANDSVGAAARNLLAAAARAPALRNADAAALRTWLAAHAPNPVPTLAAPGLSPHGQGRAVDFQVMRKGVLVAGTDSTAITSQWRRSGWAVRLEDAVRASGAPFDGPLQAPDEPWHFRYEPGAAGEGQATAAPAICRR